MFTFTIPKQHYEYYDEKKEEFLPPIDIPETTITIEHSLVSIKKWEEKWKTPFLGKKEINSEELIDYIQCMTLTENIDPKVYKWIPKEIIDKIMVYIEDPMTATWFNDDAMPEKPNSSAITAEIIYYWMLTLNIPIEFQNRHLNQLLTLIKVINIKNSKPKKVDPKTAAMQRARLNAERRAKYNSKG